MIEPGSNCWCVAAADRMAVLIDAERYFGAVREALLKARRSVWIVGWDIHAGVRLLSGAAGGDGAREDADDAAPCVLEDLLCHVLARRPRLVVRILVWDFAMIYALERDWLPLYSLVCRSHPRLCFQMDGAHPVGASHHQKLVVVDDAIAFVGGMDLSKWRWDTREHLADDSRRIDPAGKPYPPYHDVQLLVDGDAARRIGELARERWRRGTGGSVAPHAPPQGDPWPDSVEADFRDVEVAIARTLPRYKDQPEVREVERLYLDSIAAARGAIYIESQYFTSYVVAEALMRRLAEPDGPEVLLVLPLETGGWLEQTTMDVLRARLLEKLRAADRHGRLRVCHPCVPALEDGCLSVHSKLMIVDTKLLRAGSANLSNRSMGLDTECDLLLEAGNEAEERGIERVRNDLLAEHLATTPDAVAAAIAEAGGLLGALERLGAPERTLVPFAPHVREELDRVVPDSAVLDPEHPVGVEELVDHFVGTGNGRGVGQRVAVVVAILIVLGGLTVVWRFTPLREWLAPTTVASYFEGLRLGPLQALVALPAFALASTLAIPFGVLVAASAIVFGPWWGALLSFFGGWLATAAGYGVGCATGRRLVRSIAGPRLNRLSRKLAERGVLTVVAVRLVPVAPFAVVNLVAGASRIGFRDFALGSAIGLIPGVVIMTLVGTGVSGLLRDPGAGWTMALAALLLSVGLAAGFGMWFLRRRLKASNPDAS